MRQVIFLHQNSPAQFINYLEYFKSIGYSVYFLSNFLPAKPIPSVNHIKVKQDHRKQKRDSALFASYHFREALVSLRERGINPDFVFSHTGWGCGLWVKDVFPNTKFIAYSEWWFNREHLEGKAFKSKWLFYSDEYINAILGRNIYFSHELTISDKIVAPTVFQARQLPSYFQDKINVIYDGFDSRLFNRYKPIDLSRQRPVITYAARGLEAVRCFPEFIEALQIFFAHHPKCDICVKIIGNDKISYGGRPPDGYSSYGAWASNLLSPQIESGQVQFLGSLPFSQYINQLLSTSLHVYLTHHFVPSWSLAQAFCLGLPLMVNESDSTAEFFSLTPPAIKCSSTTPEDIASCLNHAYQRSFVFNVTDISLSNATRAELSIFNHHAKLTSLVDGL